MLHRLKTSHSVKKKKQELIKNFAVKISKIVLNVTSKFQLKLWANFSPFVVALNSCGGPFEFQYIIM